MDHDDFRGGDLACARRDECRVAGPGGLREGMKSWTSRKGCRDVVQSGSTTTSAGTAPDTFDSRRPTW